MAEDSYTIGDVVLKHNDGFFAIANHARTHPSPYVSFNRTELFRLQFLIESALADTATPIGMGLSDRAKKDR